MRFTYKIDPQSKDITFTFHGFDDDEDRENWNYSMETEGLRVMEHAFFEMVDDFTFTVVDPEENGDLTDGIIFTNGDYDWWDTRYALESFLEELIEHGTYTFEFQRMNRRHFDDVYDAIDYLDRVEFTSIKFYTLYFPAQEFTAELLNKIIADEWVNGRIDRYEPETGGFITSIRILDEYEDYDQPIHLANNLSALDCFIRQEIYDYDSLHNRS